MEMRRRVRTPLALLAAAGLGASALAVAPAADAAPTQSVGTAAANRSFQRVATFPVYTNLPDGTDPATETAAEIVTATSDGRTLVYSDAPAGQIGFIDITDPANPVPGGTMAFDGEPTSVASYRQWLLVAVDTSDSFTDPSGELHVIDAATRTTAATFDLGGQPDAIGVHPASPFAAIVIENQRDEDVVVDGVEGGLPQLPAGSLTRLRMVGTPANWKLDPIDLTGLAGYGGDDPEPEFVDINARGEAVVTLQENNHIAVVNLRSRKVVQDFAAGTTTLVGVDTEDDSVINPTDTLTDVPREPDAVAWLNNEFIATANEGDLFGGSRGFTVYNVRTGEVFDAGTDFEYLGISAGHYPDDRSDNKGVEPEGVEFGRFRNAGDLLFIGSERGNYVAVYRMNGTLRSPRLSQVIPAGKGPEGLLAIPQRDLFVVASEVDAADDGVRSLVNIYQLTRDAAPYPDLVSQTGPSGAPIGWGALSALINDPSDPDTLYTIHDSYYGEPRMYTIDTSSSPARIMAELPIDVPAGFRLDAEGLAIDDEGNIWIASEGRGNAGAANQTLNQLVQVAPDGSVLDIVELPAEVNANQRSNGFEGVAFHEGSLYVAVQREWTDDPAGQVKIGRYVIATGEWSFAHYPLAEVQSPAGGWVGLSELTSLGDGTFAVVERDNIPGPDKRIAWVTRVRLDDQSFGPADNPGQLVKSAPLDVLPLLNDASQSGWWGDKLEGLAVDTEGRVWYATDNDGVEDATGETLFGTLGTVADLPAAPPLTITVLADTAYGDAQRAIFPAMIDAVNADPDAVRILHLGDLKSGSSPCSDEYLGFVTDEFARLLDPLAYTPGDNEWTDCHRPAAGGFDPLERLDFLRAEYFPNPGTTIGGRAMPVRTQASDPDWAEFVENVLWTEAGVTISAVHVVGSNNSFLPWTNETPDDTARREAEATRRTEAAVDWIDATFDEAEAEGAAGVVIAMQADTWDAFSVANGLPLDGFTPIVERLAERARAFAKPVLLLQGDSHNYLVDNPLAASDPVHGITDPVPNLTRIVAPGATATSWLRLTVDPTTPAVFSWELVNL